MSLFGASYFLVPGLKTHQMFASYGDFEAKKSKYVEMII